jgi:hypothetical protein
MELNDIPQDKSVTYGGHVKLVYATRQGDYTTGVSSGWEDEEFVTQQAVIALEEETRLAFEQVISGLKSPLYFYMYRYRHDVTSLAQSSGFFKWQIKRHFNPSRFQQLSEKALSRYARAFNLPPEQLKTLPAHYD